MTAKARAKKLAVYHGKKNVSGERVAAALAVGKVPFAMITVREIEAGGLAKYAGVIFPGGHPIGVGKSGVAEVLGFVASGGGFVGVCAGTGT